MSESTYVLQEAPGTTCPACGETALLLFPDPMVKHRGAQIEKPAFYICTRCLTVAEFGKGTVPRKESIIPHFPNEVGGNAVTSLVLTTEQGVDMIFKLDPPVQQSRVMAAVGGLLARLGQKEMDFDFTLPGEGKEDKRA